jgi:hypothetical protein
MRAFARAAHGDQAAGRRRGRQLLFVIGVVVGAGCLCENVDVNVGATSSSASASAPEDDRAGAICKAAYQWRREADELRRQEAREEGDGAAEEATAAEAARIASNRAGPCTREAGA